MGLKDEIKKTVDNAKDAVSEANHRSQAQAEQTKRDVAGDEMTLGEKAGSVVNQAKHSTQAEIDSAKREVRSNS